MIEPRPWHRLEHDAFGKPMVALADMSVPARPKRPTVQFSFAARAENFA